MGACSVGSATFSNFTLIPPKSGGAIVPADTVIVVPIVSGTTVGFSSRSARRQTAGDINELAFGYLAGGASFSDATLALGGAGAEGDGSGLATQNLCIGGVFTATGEATPVPEPATMTLLATGIAIVSRSRSRKAA